MEWEKLESRMSPSEKEWEEEKRARAQPRFVSEMCKKMRLKQKKRLFTKRKISEQFFV